MNVLTSMFSQFTNAFDNKIKEFENTKNLIVGENGSLSQLTPAQSELDFDGILCEFFLLLRASTKEQIAEILERLLNITESNLITAEKRKEFLIKILKLTLFIRNPRSGKGEKQLFYNIIEELFSYNQDYQKIVFKILDLIGEFGYYKDYNNIYMQTSFQVIKNYIVQKYRDILIEDMYYSICEDEKKYDDFKQNELCKLIKWSPNIWNSLYEKFNKSGKLSLSAKWAPRENSKYHIFAVELAKELTTFIDSANYNNNKQKQLKKYRQILSKLNKKLNTVQTYMCQKHWADIDFKNVPSVSMTNLTKAFQDEKVDNRPKNKRKVVGRIKHSNNKKIFDTRRHHVGDIDYEDREKCRQNLINHIQNGEKINSKVTDLSQIIEHYMNNSNMDITWEAQWSARVAEIQNMLSSLTTKPAIFPMVDLSSSMNGSPIIHAITLGLFTSIIMDNPLTQNEFCFANRFMSFASTPQLVKLPRFSSLDNTKSATLKEKVDIMKDWTQGGRWGGSTNIHAAIDLLLTIASENKVPQSDMPKILAIFSDMQFDQGDSSWNKTSYDNICDKFKNAGYEVPHVLFWNLRGNTVGFQVKADTPNSSMLSGYSTRMLDLFLSADLTTMQTEFSNIIQNNNEEIKEKKTTLTLLNKALNHEMFEKYNNDFDKLF